MIFEAIENDTFRVFSEEATCIGESWVIE